VAGARGAALSGSISFCRRDGSRRSGTATTDGSVRLPRLPRGPMLAVAERTRGDSAAQRGQADGSADAAMGRASENGPQISHWYS
jgi:hypothetical protein